MNSDVSFFIGLVSSWIILQIRSKSAKSIKKTLEVETSSADSVTLSRALSKIIPEAKRTLVITDEKSNKMSIMNQIMTRESALGKSGHIVLGIAGGSGSGKTTLAQAVVDALGKENITFISHDSYYRDLSHLPMELREAWNFDHPDSLETSLLIEHVKILKKNQAIRIPRYDYGSHSRVEGLVDIFPKRVIIIEGILIFSDPLLCEQMDIKIFVDTDDDIRLIRRMQRDILERQRTVSSVIDQYLKTVRPMHIEFVAPSRHKADIIIPVGVNSVALDLLVSRLHTAMVMSDAEDKGSDISA
eukprot:gene4780-9511_t